MFEYDRLALDVADQISNNSNHHHHNSNKANNISTPMTTNKNLPLSHNYFDSYLLRGSLQQSAPGDETIPRRLSGGSSANDIFDCGASSGYGSPGFVGTPLASPAPNVQCLANQLHKMFLDQGFCDDSLNGGSMPVPNNCSSFGSSLSGHSPRSYELLALSNSMKEFNKPSSYNAFAQPPPSIGTSPLNIDLSSLEQLEDYGMPSSMPPITSQSVTPASRNSNKVNPIAGEDGFSTDEIQQFAELLCSPKKAPPVRYQCHICYNNGHYISDCPMRFNSPYEELTPYQGRKKCYGEFQCQLCKRKWTSQNSVANEAQSCIKCHVPVFPHKQLPVDKAVSLGLVKAQKTVPAKIAPIGHGRPPFAAVGRN